MRIIRPQPLTREAFAPFGDVISVESAEAKAANQGSAIRSDFTTPLHNARPNAKPNVAVFRSKPRTLPFQIVMLERHTQSSQMFSPMSVARYVVVVAPSTATGECIQDQVQAFLANPLQAINYRAGTWHHPLLVLDREAQFLMVAFEDGSAHDCEELKLTQQCQLHVDP